MPGLDNVHVPEGKSEPEARAEVNTEAEEAKVILNAQINALYVARSLSYQNEGFMEGMNLRKTLQPPRFSLDTLDLSSYIRRKCLVAGREETLVYKLGVGYRGIPHARYEGGSLDANGHHSAVSFDPPGPWAEFCPLGSEALNNAIRYIEASMRAFEKRMGSDPTQKDKPRNDFTAEELATIEEEMRTLVSDTSDPAHLSLKKTEENEVIPQNETVLTSEDFSTLVRTTLDFVDAEDTTPKTEEWSEKIYRFPRSDARYVLRLEPTRKGEGYNGLNLKLYGNGKNGEFTLLLTGGSSFDKHGKDAVPFKDILRSYVEGK